MRVRTSTIVLLVAFVAILVLYLEVRPAPVHDRPAPVLGGFVDRIGR